MSHKFLVFCCVLLLTTFQWAYVCSNPVPLASKNGPVPDPAPKSEKAASNNECAKIMSQATASSFYLVGHAIHSMTVRDLRKFDPLATTVNFVPTINRDASSRDALFSHAPDITTTGDEKFLTEAMKTLNYGLTHMDEKNVDIKGYSPLERIIHAFHMQEVWARALKQFEMIKANPPSPDVCECALDIKNNGILKFLRFTALAIREPDLIYGGGLDTAESRSNESDQGGRKKRSASPRSYRNYQEGRKKRNAPLRSYRNYQEGRKKRDVSSANSWDTQILKKEEDAQLPVTDAASWKKNAEMLGRPTPEMDYNTALFIYCAVQKAHSVK